MPFGHGLWLWFSKNPIAQAIAGVFVFLLLKARHARYHQHRGERRERERNLKRSQKVQKTALEKSNEKSENLDRTIDAVEHSPDTASLSKRVRDRFIRYERDDQTDRG